MTQKLQDEKFMRFAFQIVENTIQKGFDHFRAILVKEGKIASASTDKCIAYSHPTSHAELVLISEFCRKNKLIDLEGYIL